MKLLFDQNISYRIIKLIREKFPESKQVKELKLVDSSDLEIFLYAQKNGYQIVTFDSDFYDLANLSLNSPKIIWLRFGNTSTNKLAEIIIDKYDEIKSFIENEENSEHVCLEVIL